jgi:hypothetical protein
LLIAYHDTQDTALIIQNICSFVGQLDDHAPYLTVRETFEFAFQCRTGGDFDDKKGTKTNDAGAGTETAIPHGDGGGVPATATAGTGDNGGGGGSDEEFTENLTIKGLDLSVCADTFVGNGSVRGVSGGQRRRVVSESIKKKKEEKVNGNSNIN